MLPELRTRTRSPGRTDSDAEFRNDVQNPRKNHGPIHVLKMQRPAGLMYTARRKHKRFTQISFFTFYSSCNRVVT